MASAAGKIAQATHIYMGKGTGLAGTRFSGVAVGRAGDELAETGVSLHLLRDARQRKLWSFNPASAGIGDAYKALDQALGRWAATNPAASTATRLMSTPAGIRNGETVIVRNFQNNGKPVQYFAYGKGDPRIAEVRAAAERVNVAAQRHGLPEAIRNNSYPDVPPSGAIHPVREGRHPAGSVADIPFILS